MKQFSLFVPHESTVGEKIPVERVEAVSKPKVSIESEAAKKILHQRERGKKEIKSPVVKDAKFILDSCRICGNKRLERYCNVYLCKRCGSEHSEHGIVFGNKIKKGDSDK